MLESFVAALVSVNTSYLMTELIKDIRYITKIVKYSTDELARKMAVSTSIVLFSISLQCGMAVPQSKNAIYAF